jgi:alginate O-acetyltransferase complex protein AlgI
MLFNSFTFWGFFACVLVLYALLRHRGQNLMLLIASNIFYGAWDWRFLTLIWLSTTVDFAAGIIINSSDSPARRRALLAISLCFNLGLLGFFKYYDFFAAQLEVLLQTIGISSSLPVLNVLLPVGISFYTFQSISYTIDVYRRQCEPTHSLINFALYVCFFPQLVAGPIERYSQLMPQIANPRRVTRDCWTEGLYHIMIGLFKKVVLADNMASIVQAIFATPLEDLSGFECLVGAYAFAMQVYGDFSGYSSIAQGVAKLMGFNLMYNFRMPYFAASPSDFWHRWHISLSLWLRDYLYIPLGGNRLGSARTYINLMATMALGGLWHGAAWTYIWWGIFHGALLCIYRPVEHRLRPQISSNSWNVPRLVLALLMFHLVCTGWILFRAVNLNQATGMLAKIVGDPSWLQLTSYPDRFALAWTGLGQLLLFAGPLLLLEFWIERSGNMLALLHVHWIWRALVYSYFALMLLFFPPVVKHEFIYFQF